MLPAGAGFLQPQLPLPPRPQVEHFVQKIVLLLLLRKTCELLAQRMIVVNHPFLLRPDARLPLDVPEIPQDEEQS